MTIRHLDALFDPASVVVIGASDRPSSVGAQVWRNIGAAGFRGTLHAVNLRRPVLADGVRAHATLTDLPAPAELAVICTPAATVAPLVAELAAAGTRAAVVLSAGLTAAQKQAMFEAARPHLLRVLGPNCIGLQVPQIGLDASFAHAFAGVGDLAFVSQSGALFTAMIDWARRSGIGLSKVVSLGEHDDIDFGDMLDYLASDARTRAILLYIESLQHARKFMSAARAAARNKPVIVIKAGRSAPGARAAASHSGAMAGADEVVDAAIRRAGMLRVNSLRELFLAAETLSRWRGNTAERLLILTNGGGLGVVAADAAGVEGIELATLAPETVARLDVVLPPNWSRGNPLDIIGDAPVERYVHTIEALEGDPAAQAVLFAHAPTAIVSSVEIARALAPLAQRHEPWMLSCWVGGEAVDAAAEVFRQAGVPSFWTPEDGVRAFAMLVDYRRNQAQLIEAPPAVEAPPATPDLPAARGVIDAALARNEHWLHGAEAKTVLQAFGIAGATTHRVGADALAAAAAASSIGFPVALKIHSPDILHKSDVGGVALDLGDAAAVQTAATAMLDRVARRCPGARDVGLTVQAMVRRAHARELIVGSAIDPVFGPVVVFGEGGVAVEVLADRALALPPLNASLAHALIARTRVARLLGAYRDIPAANVSAVASVLVAVSQLLADVPEVAELDINPLLVDETGAIALDARIHIDAARPGGAAHFAIVPYPAQEVEQIEWQGQPLTVRPIRPEDEARHLEFLGSLSPDDIRLRVFYSRRSIERTELARLTQIDYARELAYVAIGPDAAGKARTLGVVRAVIDPDNQDAEFGIIIRSEAKGGGLGVLLMNKLIRTLRERGTRRLVATVLAENQGMLALGRRLGFRLSEDQPDPDTRAIVLEL